jgi:hypothetical protein
MIAWKVDIKVRYLIGLIKYLCIKASIQSYIIFYGIIINDGNTCTADIIESIVILASLYILTFFIVYSFRGVVEVVIHLLNIYQFLSLFVLIIVHLKEVYISLSLCICYYYNTWVLRSQCCTNAWIWLYYYYWWYILLILLWIIFIWIILRWWIDLGILSIVYSWYIIALVILILLWLLWTLIFNWIICILGIIWIIQITIILWCNYCLIAWSVLLWALSILCRLTDILRIISTLILCLINLIILRLRIV